MNKIKIVLAALIFWEMALISCVNKESTAPKKIQTVKVGIQEWQTKNLDVSVFCNGDPIPEAKTEKEWKKAGLESKPAWCYYDNDPVNGRKFGKLYNWYAVNDPRGLCPEGWHIPSDNEWNDFIRSLGEGAGNKLKSTCGWFDNKNGSDSLGFVVLPSGMRYSSGAFDDIGRFAYYWTCEYNQKINYRFIGYMDSKMRKGDNIILKGTGMSVRGIRRVKYDGFSINPPEVPNDGILFVNNEINSRSGHYGQALTECENGDILAFYMNVSGEIYGGHGCAGWSEYRRSTDGGKTWGEPKIMKYSKKVWEDNKLEGDSVPKGTYYNASYVASAVTAPNGNIVLIYTRRKATQNSTIGHFTPVYMISYDNGLTWSEPKELDKSATVDELALTHGDRASFIYDGVIYVGFIGGETGYGKYSLYASEDNGETFKKRSDGLFEKRPYEKNFYYMTANVLEDGRFIFYSYYYMGDERVLPYVISNDKGYTWSEVKTTFMEKRIRAGQMSDKIGDYYFLQGRSGMKGDDPWCTVLYASKDGINWDRGRFLNKIQKGMDSYSSNEVIGKYDPSTKNRLLIQTDNGYSGYARVNVKHWWIENIEGCE